MKNTIKVSIFRFQRPYYFALTMQVLVASVFLMFPTSDVNAVQLTNRHIRMSDSAQSANGTITTGVGSGTNVSYAVGFDTTSTSTAVGGIVIDFCANSPLAGDTCTAPTGFNSNAGTMSISGQTGLGSGSFSVYTPVSAVPNRITLTRTTPANPAGSATFVLGDGVNNGFTNPDTTNAQKTFYARIYTYATASAAQSHSSSNPLNYIDNGGIALSTANVITISAQVQENLIFCVFGAVAPNDNCVAAAGSEVPALEIGHTNGSAALSIDSSAVDTADAFMQVSTNAGNGVAVHMRSSAAGGGLINGSDSIPPVGTGAATPSAITAGLAAFGLIVFPGTGSIGVLEPDANYYNAAHDTVGEIVHYGMDSTTATNVNTTFGDPIATTGGATSNMTSKLTFAATASNVTPAGKYTTEIALIATGKF